MIYKKGALILLGLLCIMPNLVIAKSENPPPESPPEPSPTIVGPWMTGPLLAPAGHTIPAHHINIEPYVFLTDNIAQYNSHWGINNTPNLFLFSPTMVITIGLASRMDFEFSVPYDLNFSQGQSEGGYGDITLYLGFQALNNELHGWRPDLRITLQETFPSGKYDDLDPAKKIPTLEARVPTKQAFHLTSKNSCYCKMVNIFAAVSV